MFKQKAKAQPSRKTSVQDVQIRLVAVRDFVPVAGQEDRVVPLQRGRQYVLVSRKLLKS